jgi:F0F1-type ATP synthase membrane subunit c/vacuolar-type H+-ATPase subunit K
MLFLKAAKIIATSVVFLPLAGCALATGVIFSSLVRGVAYAPEQEGSMFTYAMLGFGLVETYALMLWAVCGLIQSL